MDKYLRMYCKNFFCKKRYLYHVASKNSLTKPRMTTAITHCNGSCRLVHLCFVYLLSYNTVVSVFDYGIYRQLPIVVLFAKCALKL
jgi:hypothetical protein